MHAIRFMCFVALLFGVALAVTYTQYGVSMCGDSFTTVSVGSGVGNLGDSLVMQGNDYFLLGNVSDPPANPNSKAHQYLSRAAGFYPASINNTVLQATKISVPRYEKWQLNGIAVAVGDLSLGSNPKLVFGDGSLPNLSDDSMQLDLNLDGTNYARITCADGCSGAGCTGVCDYTCAGTFGCLDDNMGILRLELLAATANLTEGSYWMSFIHPDNDQTWIWFPYADAAPYVDNATTQAFCGVSQSCKKFGAFGPDWLNATSTWTDNPETGNNGFELCGTVLIDDPCNDLFSNQTDCDASSNCSWCGENSLCLSECSINPWCTDLTTCSDDLCSAATDELSCVGLAESCGWCGADSVCVVDCLNNAGCSNAQTCVCNIDFDAGCNSTGIGSSSSPAERHSSGLVHALWFIAEYARPWLD